MSTITVFETLELLLLKMIILENKMSTSSVRYNCDPIHPLGLAGERGVSETHARSTAMDPKCRLIRITTAKP